MAATPAIIPSDEAEKPLFCGGSYQAYSFSISDPSLSSIMKRMKVKTWRKLRTEGRRRRWWWRRENGHSVKLLRQYLILFYTILRLHLCICVSTSCIVKPAHCSSERKEGYSILWRQQPPPKSISIWFHANLMWPCTDIDRWKIYDVAWHEKEKKKAISFWRGRPT